MATSQLDSQFLKDPDVQAMLRVREGEESAFAGIVDRYQHRLIAIFVQMFGDRETAEELAREVFLRVYRARNGYKPTAKFSTYVFGIAHMLAGSNRRSKGAKAGQQTGSDADPASAAQNEQQHEEESTPGQQLDRKQLQEHVRQAMESLNDPQRMALLLHKFEGFRYADIGEVMELTPAAVKSLLSQARETLRTRLEPYMK